MANFYKKISGAEIAAIRRVVADCENQTRAAACHVVVRELNPILDNILDRPDLVEQAGGGDMRLNENKAFCEEKWDDDFDEPLSKLFTPEKI